MDDQQQPPFPQPHEPVTEEPTQPLPATGTAEPASADKPHRGRRAIATMTATALVAGLGGVGAGYAVGHGLARGARPSPP